MEQWPGGFAALINLVDIPTRTELDAGWTVAIVFDKPLGKVIIIVQREKKKIKKDMNLLRDYCLNR